MRLTNTIPHTCSRCTREPFGQSTSALPPHALPQGPCGTNLYDLNRTFYMPFPELFSALGHRRHLATGRSPRSEEHTSELQSHVNLVCRLLLEKNKNTKQ